MLSASPPSPMTVNSYERPEPFTWDKVALRTLLPVYPPPGPLDYPTLPTPQRAPSFDAGYALTTHILPACHLRTTRDVPEPELPPVDLPKQERMEKLEELRLYLKSLRTSTVTDGYPRILWNVVNRYARKGLNASNSTGVTLFLAHANGFPKEIWEPTLALLLSGRLGTIVDEVWAWEAANHGDSAILNASRATALYDWQDNSRDIINFLAHYLPESTYLENIPTHLARVSPEETLARLENGFVRRQVVTIGHSFGGATSTLAAEIYPSLFTSLILIDPVIIQPYADHLLTKNPLALGALARRGNWSSREEAHTSFAKNPFFQAWDPAVLKIYVECGLYDAVDADGKTVTKLKMSGMQEAVCFTEVHTGYEVFDRLPQLDERVSLRWVMPGKPGAPELGGPGSNQRKVWTRLANSSNVKIQGGGHLIPQEAPHELAKDIEQYLLSIFPSHAVLRSSL